MTFSAVPRRFIMAPFTTFLIAVIRSSELRRKEADSRKDKNRN
jgi:hypothetical protein